MINTKKVVYVADYFANEICGGAELCAEEQIKSLQKRGFELEKLKSVECTSNLLKDNKDCFWIISNFMLLPEDSKQTLINEKINYLIVENDWKAFKSNNPALFPNLVVPEDQIQNKQFFKSAKAVFCQSKKHAEIMEKNLLLKNIVNIGCNIWSDEAVEVLRNNIGKKKNRKVGIIQSNNKNKGMPEAIQYCKKNKINYELIPFCDQDRFFDELAKTETLVFFPTWIETFCRVAIEARILGCKLITNKALGCASEDFFKLKGEELLEYIAGRKEKTIDLFEKVIKDKEVEKFNSVKLPKVSVITTIYKAKEHIKGFMDSFVAQTISDDSELIIIDANSPDDEVSIISKYIQVHTDNIKYIRKNTQITPMEAFNEATKLASGEFIACVLADDRMANDHLETLAKHLMLNPEIDLVYGDCLQTTKPNETVEQNSSKGRLYEHSRMDFSRENMIKCLPGPLPLYRKSIHDKAGLWDEKLKHAGDWELWLRAVRAGSLFKKVNKILGLYYYNPDGLSTSSDPDKMLRRRREERDVFHEFKDVIGESNYNTFKEYFDSVE